MIYLTWLSWTLNLFRKQISRLLISNSLQAFLTSWRADHFPAQICAQSALLCRLPTGISLSVDFSMIVAEIDASGWDWAHGNQAMSGLASHHWWRWIPNCSQEGGTPTETMSQDWEDVHRLWMRQIVFCWAKHPERLWPTIRHGRGSLAAARRGHSSHSLFSLVLGFSQNPTCLWSNPWMPQNVNPIRVILLWVTLFSSLFLYFLRLFALLSTILYWYRWVTGTCDWLGNLQYAILTLREEVAGALSKSCTVNSATKCINHISEISQGINLFLQWDWS